MSRAATATAAIRGGEPSQRKKSIEHADAGVVLEYLDASQRPWAGLLFVLPMLLCYELATGLWGHYPVERAPAPIVAFSLMQQFFGWFGATGRYLPALAIV